MPAKKKYDINHRVHLLLLVSTIFVSTSFIVADIIADALDPIALTFIRFFIAALIFLPIVAVRHNLKIAPVLFVGNALISGCLVIFFWTMFLALRYTTPLNISVLFTLVPAMSALLAAGINRERIGVHLVCALVIGLAGAVWVIFGGDFEQFGQMVWNRGDLIFFGGCMAMALYTPLIRRVHRNQPMEVMAFWILVSGCLWLLPGTIYTLSSMKITEIASAVWMWIVYLAVFSTVTSFYMTQYATRMIGPTRTISYSYLYPMLVVLLEFLIGHGWPPLQILPGIALTIGAMLLLRRSAPHD